MRLWYSILRYKNSIKDVRERSNMDILKKIQNYEKDKPESIALICGDQNITYRDLNKASDALALYMEEYCSNREPVAVYGHKSPLMLVTMLACVKSGRAYCPIDVSVPGSRVQIIISQLESDVILATEDMDCITENEINDSEGDDSRNISKNILSRENILNIIQAKVGSEDFDKKRKELKGVKAEDVFYIIFTSGSTGNPKGVQITTECLNNYLDWSRTLCSEISDEDDSVFLNQAPFSFDLSVMDLYTCLSFGGTLWTLDKDTQNDYGKLMDSLAKSNANVWVSTPSFADICLTEKAFDEKLMPKLNTFLFCGETLTNTTAGKLMKRFTTSKIINTYGPTESTVAITEVLVNEETLEKYSPLPVGKTKPGTEVEIWNENGEKVPDGEKGEIIILGNTVSVGYYRNEENTKKAFFTKNQMRGYRTGDKGYIKDGMLFYCGRIDLQVKLHGYRIELEDIESNIMKLEEISQAVVLPNMKDDKVRSLTAYVVYNGEIKDKNETVLMLKEKAKSYLPDYMIPKKFVFMEHIPMTNNGKADRKVLKAMSGK